eukprot:SAG11_NODE_2816_length_2943_cov_7.547117_3_plen_74_part_00
MNCMACACRGSLTLFVPDLEGLAADAIKDGEETRLKGILEHRAGRLELADLLPISFDHNHCPHVRGRGAPRAR